MAYRMGIVVACLLASMTVNVMAQENGFRLETDVFVQGNDKPVSRTVTLFHNGVAYDFPRDGQRVTMVDPSGNRIVIFDTQRSVQTVVDIKELAKLMETAKKQAPEFLTAIIAEASLSFIGLGVQPPTPSWGQMIKDGYGYIALGTNWGRVPLD